MSDVAEHPKAPDDHGDDHHEGHGHPPYLAHHFDSTSQQSDSGKLGMWIFLSTEILMFGGLFCAYAIYRGNHPEIFLYAHKFLDTKLGAINTVILLTSSMTMAWGVRAAMLGQKRLLEVLLLLTLLGAVGFLVVKYFEYSAKFATGMYPGARNAYYAPEAANEVLGLAGDDAYTDEIRRYRIYNIENYYLGSYGVHHEVPEHYRQAKFGYKGAYASADAPSLFVAATRDDAEVGAVEPDAMGELPVERSTIPPVATGPRGLNPAFRATADDEVPQATAHTVLTYDSLPAVEQERVHLFFQIYYMMTGLHVLHVLIGMGLITWLYIKTVQGAFTSGYYFPVDIVGLYWHLVDLIWIFLFPLLYLIH